ncbi:Uncharacterised protein [Corynebacterium striatum]|nr:Uncharacterised protein [Corynebacterium striatum]
MPPRNPHDLPVHSADHTRPRADSASSSTRASTQRRPINSRPIDTRRAGNGNPDGEPTYVRRTPPKTPKTSTSTAPKTLPNRQKHNPRPKPRSKGGRHRAQKTNTPAPHTRVLHLWSSSGKFRITVGVLASAALASATLAATMHRVVDPPEGLESNQVPVAAAPVIEPSAAVEMFIPAIEVHAEFEDGSCRVKNGAIDPETMAKACTYTAADRPYSLPGTNAPDITVIAGHTGAGVPAVFNNLYDGGANKHKVALGDKLYLRTANSGDNWLVYSATDMHDPVKEGLAEDPAIWGEGPMPGRLLTISCIQPPNLLEASVRNAVVGWQFEGITAADATGVEAPLDVSNGQSS